MLAYYLTLNQDQQIDFVMVDAAGVELPGLAGLLVVELSKATDVAFNPAVGAQSEKGDGWYTYTLDASSGEVDTPGPLDVIINAPGAQQQNIPCVVKSAAVNAIEFTYTVTSSVPPNPPIEGVAVWITTDIGGFNVVWNGETDALGVARDGNGELPWLDPGTYFFWRQKAGWEFSPEPDTEIVS